MKRFAFIMSAMLVMGSVWGAPADRTIGFVVEKGLYQHIRAAVFRAFPPKKITEPDGEKNEITVRSVSPEDEKAFVAMLRRLGHNVIEPENNGDMYRIRIMEDADRELSIEVDTTAFKSQSQTKRLLELQSIMGRGVTGGANELLNIKKGDTTGLWWALLNGNFDYKFTDENGVKRLVVTERQIPVIILFTSALQDDLINALVDMSSVLASRSGNKVTIAVSGSQLGEVRNKLREYLGGFSESSVDFSWVFIPAQPKKHTLTVILNKGDKFDAQRAQVLAAVNSKSAKADFLVESMEEESVGSRCIMTFSIVSYKSVDVLSNTIVNMLRECNVKRNKIEVD